MKHLALTILAVSFISACTTIQNPGQRIGALPPAPQPNYAPGDVFVYDDGYIEEVTAVEGNTVRWALGHGHTFADRSTDFLTPAMAWTVGDARYTFTEASRSARMWPLQTGASTTIKGQQSVEQFGRTTAFPEQWACQATDSERLSLAAGVFDTFVVTCERSSPTRAHAQKRRFNYAPSVQHYVRVIEEMRSTTTPGYARHQRDLVHFNKAPSSGHRQALTRALSQTPSGQSSEWVDQGQSSRLHAQATYLDEHQHVCRDVALAQASTNVQASLCFVGETWTHQKLRLPR